MTARLLRYPILTLSVAAAFASTAGCRSKEPRLSVFSPAESSHFVKGDTIHFASELNSDLDPGVIDSSDWHWVSDIDGDIGHGPRVDVTSLTVGKHEVTASVRHRLGLTKASVRVFVDAAKPYK
jgi:hypothetical protein